MSEYDDFSERLAEILNKYRGKTIDVSNYPMGDYYGDPPDDCFFWVSQDTEEFEPSEYDLESIEEDCMVPVEDYDDDVPEDEWEYELDEDEYEEQVTYETGWTREERENGRTVYVEYSVGYEVDEYSRLQDLTEICARILRGDDATRVNYDDFTVTKYDYDHFEDNLNDCVFDENGTEREFPIQLMTEEREIAAFITVLALSQQDINLLRDHADINELSEVAVLQPLREKVLAAAEKQIAEAVPNGVEEYRVMVGIPEELEPECM